MRKPGTNPDSVEMSDVLCDFCRREWLPEQPMIEGHQGSCICGQCLTVAYTEVVVGPANLAPAEFTCPMCLESSEDRAALDRADEPGWQSPLAPDAVICRRCIELAARALEKNDTFDWARPGR